MLNGPANTRGYAQIAPQPFDDSIVDGYGGRFPGIFTNSLPATPPAPGPILVGVPDPATAARELRTMALGAAFPPPTPEASYLHYESWVWIEVDSGVVPVRPLPPRAPLTTNQLLTGSPFAGPVGPLNRASFFDVINDAIGGLMPAFVPGGLGGPAVFLAPPQQRSLPVTFVDRVGPSAASAGAVFAARLDRGTGVTRFFAVM